MILNLALLALMIVLVALPLTPAGLAEARYADAAGWCVLIWTLGCVVVAVVAFAWMLYWLRRNGR